MVKNGQGRLNVGGVVGFVYSFTNIDGSSAVTGGLMVEKNGTGTSNIGGFGGSIGITSTSYTGIIKNNYADGPVDLATGAGATGEVSMGGFVGHTIAYLEYCYATADISALGRSAIYIGGFAGFMRSGGNASYCYAMGNVSAIHQGTGNSGIQAGGFAGYGAVISNCYATGDVFADYTGTGTGSGTTVDIGGLVGIMLSSISNSFAKGNVIAQRNNNNANGINAGGIAGYSSGGLSIANSAALGESITVTNTRTAAANGRNIGRIFSGNPAITLTNNYAFNGMKLYSDSRYAPRDPAQIPFDDIADDADSKDGADANLANFRTSAFWTGLGFSEADWIFTGIGTRGYPLLRGSKNGTVLGGQ